MHTLQQVGVREPRLHYDNPAATPLCCTSAYVIDMNVRKLTPGDWLYTQTICVPGEPMPWSVYTKQGKPSIGFEKMKAYQETVQLYLKRHWVPRPPLTKSVALEFIFARGIPSSARKTQPRRDMWCDDHLLMRPDVTNYQKAAEDAMKGIVYLDDSQVVKITSQKIYTEGGGYTCITIITEPSKMQEES